MRPETITGILRLTGWLFLFGLTFLGVVSLVTLWDVPYGISLGSLGTGFVLISLLSGIGSIVAGAFMWAICPALAIITEAILDGLDVMQERLPAQPPLRLRRVVRRL